MTISPQYATLIAPYQTTLDCVLEGNQPFWMVNNGILSATDIKVFADGTIETTWVVTDKFDFIPTMERNFEYNFFAIPIYFFYNIVGGAKEQVPVNASWDETIPPVEE